MSKLHYCEDGTPVTQQVITYQRTHNNDDFKPILKYYQPFKEIWYLQVQDYMDRPTFDSEFDYKVFRAADSFNAEAAEKNSNTKGLDYLGNFNRWLYKILMNWKSNIKTSSVRLKKRPGIHCPVCGRVVGKIDEDHLQHIKSVSDLPSHMSYKGEIYDVYTKPKSSAVTWGKYNQSKLNALLKGEYVHHIDDKKKTAWPWRLQDGKRGVLCPFTKKIIPIINDEYIQSLDIKHNRYAEVLTWDEFVRKYPSSLIQSEIFSLERPYTGDKTVSLKDHISQKSSSSSLSKEMVDKGEIGVEFEHSFVSIEKYIKDTVSINILKLIAAGYSVDDVCEEMELDKKDVRSKIKSIRLNRDLCDALMSK